METKKKKKKDDDAPYVVNWESIGMEEMKNLFVLETFKRYLVKNNSAKNLKEKLESRIKLVEKSKDILQLWPRKPKIQQYYDGENLIEVPTSISNMNSPSGNGNADISSEMTLNQEKENIEEYVDDSIYEYRYEYQFEEYHYEDNEPSSPDPPLPTIEDDYDDLPHDDYDDLPHDEDFDDPSPDTPSLAPSR